jgi:chemotaxis protein MotA
MGMIGTVIGLVAMFASMDDPARMGPAMALAMLTTLYGLLFGTLVFGAVAARLERLSEAELRWQRAALARIEALARSEAGGAELWLKHSARTSG